MNNLYDDPELEKYLRAKFEQPDRSQDLERVANERTDRLAEQNINSSLIQGLLSAANKVGSIGGHTADVDLSGFQNADKQRSQQMAGITTQQKADQDRAQKERLTAMEQYLKGKREKQALAQAQTNKDAELDLKRQSLDQTVKYQNEMTDIKRQLADAKNVATEAKTPKNPYQPEVNAIMAKNAAKKSIANQMEGYLQQYRGAKNDDQKLVIGRQMLKVLNSPEGADAIGAEEAKRLGSLLEYKFLNFTNPGSVVGRDLGEFDTQVVDTINSVRGGIDANQKEIESLMAGQGGQPQKRVEPLTSKVPGTATAAPSGKIAVSNGSETLYIDPNDLSDAEADGYKEVK